MLIHFNNMNVNYVFNLLKIKVFCLASLAPKQCKLKFLNFLIKFLK